MRKISIDGKEVSLRSVEDETYFSLTDMVRKNPHPADVIRNWLRSRSTLEFLIFWETVNNPEFKTGQADQFKNEAGSPSFTLRPKGWIDETNAIGIQSKSGRYGGGTWAHVDIAIQFASYISPVFQYHVIQEFKKYEAEKSNQLSWNYARFLSKVNLDLQKSAIEKMLIPRVQAGDKSYAYAEEADLINLAVFGLTARQWREANPDLKGNVRDHASILELTILANLESLNAYLIEAGASKEARFERLLHSVQSQATALLERENKNLPYQSGIEPI